MNIIVIAPHPDDESIGCGGTIAKHISNGDLVSVIFLTSGEKGGHGKEESETICIRESEAKTAAHLLKITDIEFWRMPDGKISVSEEFKEKLLSKIRSLEADMIYTTNINEQHLDHKQATKLVIRTLQKITKNAPLVLFYEVWTPLQNIDHIEDISEFIQIKMNAIRAHKSQCDVLKFDEAIMGLNRYRGEMHSWPGGDYAEVFENASHKYYE